MFYVDLTIRAGITLEDAITQAKELDSRRKACGFDQAALDEAARQGFEQGVFEDGGDDDGAAVVEEFFPRIETEAGVRPVASAPVSLSAGKPGLREKLAGRAGSPTGAAS